MKFLVAILAALGAYALAQHYLSGQAPMLGVSVPGWIGGLVAVAVIYFWGKKH